MPEGALPKDTSLDAARVQIAFWQRKSPAERVKAALSMSEAARRTFEAGIRRDHPEYSEQQVRLRAMRLRFGSDLVDRIMGGQTNPSRGGDRPHEHLA